MATETTDKNTKVRDVLIETAQLQLASTSAAVGFWAAWAEATSGFAREMNSELASMLGREETTDEDLVRFADLSRNYLRKLSDLPDVAAKHFTSELEKFRTSGPRVRPVRVKE